MSIPVEEGSTGNPCISLDSFSFLISPLPLSLVTSKSMIQNIIPRAILATLGRTISLCNVNTMARGILEYQRRHARIWLVNGFGRPVLLSKKQLTVAHQDSILTLPLMALVKMKWTDSKLPTFQLQCIISCLFMKVQPQDAHNFARVYQTILPKLA